jgi:hypothetical protein
LDCGDGDERVGFPVPPPHLHLHVGQPETPVPPEQAEIVDRGPAAALDDKEDVIDEHRLGFAVGENPLVAFGQNTGVGQVTVVREGDKGRQQAGSYFDLKN